MYTNKDTNKDEYSHSHDYNLSIAFFTGVGMQSTTETNLLILDGINVSETPSLLVEVEALGVPVVLAVSLQDLKDFPTVRLIAKGSHDAWPRSDPFHRYPCHNKGHQREWLELLDGSNLKYTTKSLEYTLDLSPDHITVIPQLVKERIAETPSLGRTIYLNSFVVGAKPKALSAIQSYQQAGFKFTTISDCLHK